MKRTFHTPRRLVRTDQPQTVAILLCAKSPYNLFRLSFRSKGFFASSSSLSSSFLCQNRGEGWEEVASVVGIQ